MSLIHGSHGLIYFVHQFQPAFKEAALLEDPEMLAAVTGINRRIHELAPVLNSPDAGEGIKVEVLGFEAGEAKSIAWMHKRHGGSIYIFAVNMRNEPVRCSFSISGCGERAAIQVLDEGRSVPAQVGKFTDDFKPYEVHLYSAASNP